MKTMIVAVAALLALAPGLAGAGSDEPLVAGDYVEARTCDVWTGPCFANGEMNLKGRQAVVAWKVGAGSFEGVRLDGLAVAAAVLAEGTLGTDQEGALRAALLVDERADARQAAALVAMAKSLAPRYLANVVRTDRAPIALERKGLEARLAVGDVAVIKTGEFCACDVICCNEEQFYPALSQRTTVTCAKTLEHAYRGTALDSRWSEPNKRSAMVGRFAR